MGRRGPLITLLVVVVLAGILLAVNLARSPSNQAGSGTAGQAGSPAGQTGSLAAPPAAEVAPSAAAPAPAVPPAPGSTPSQFPGQAKYTGYTDGNHAAIAVTVRGGKVSAYLCDGKAVEGWYQGSATGGTVEAKGRGTNALSGTLSGTKLSGTVSAGGKSWTYSAAPAAAPAGLYRSKATTGTTGWIKDSSGKVTGLRNAGGRVEPAPPLDPSTAQSVEGGDQVVGQ